MSDPKAWAWSVDPNHLNLAWLSDLGVELKKNYINNI